MELPRFRQRQNSNMEWLGRGGRTATALFFLALGAGWAAAEVAEPEPNPFLDTFEEAWSIINEFYYDPEFQGLDWEAVYETHLPVVEMARDWESVRLVIRNMLGRLRQSHFALIPREATPTADTPGAAGPAAMTDAGLTIVEAENRFLVFRVRPGSAADEAGIRPGQVLKGIRGQDLQSWVRAFSTLDLPERLRRYYLLREIENQLRGRVGQPLELLFMDQADQEQVHHLQLKASGLDRSTGFANMPVQILDFDHTELEGGVVLLRFNFFALELFEQLKSGMVAAREAEAPGIIFDLRGNAGGIGTMAALLTAHLIGERLSLGTMHLRNGQVHYLAYPQPDPYRQPVAILVDGRTASTGEILAAGLQSAGRARIFGQPTAGAVMPSMIRELPNGDRLQYVVGDFRTPQGVRLEGVGVVPDVLIPVRREDLLAGRDAPLEQARLWIHQQQSKDVR